MSVNTLAANLREAEKILTFEKRAALFYLSTSDFALLSATALQNDKMERDSE